MGIFSLSPLDGRYKKGVDPLWRYFSEGALQQCRLWVEVELLIAFGDERGMSEMPEFSSEKKQELRDLYLHFSEEDAKEIKKTEDTIHHDVKSIEYFLKNKLDMLGVPSVKEFVHFSCTSEDINNLAYALMLRGGIQEVLLPEMEKLRDTIKNIAQQWKDIPLLARTHGQPASPTTVGKELWVFEQRLSRQITALKKCEFLGKLNGATGNFNAHIISYPEVDWIKFSTSFIQSLGLTPHFATTQIEPHDFLGEIFDVFRRYNTILIDFNRDIWGYISLGFFKQKVVEGEVGSSTMPHKVNPINFEKSEGNLGIANSLFSHFSEKLPVSRWQRDLTDSTVLRNIGIAFGYSLVAYRAAMKGIDRLELHAESISDDLDNSWEILAEAIQMVMRRYGVSEPYEKLKELTRGKIITKEVINDFVQRLEIPEAEKQKLIELTPRTYIGIANKLVDM